MTYVDPDEPAAPRPSKPSYRFAGDTLPPALEPFANERRFVVWHYIWKPKTRKWDKVPFDPRTRKAASVSDPKTWGTAAEALACAQRHPGTITGIGIILTRLAKDAEGGKITRISGADLDDCITDAGSLTPLAAVVLGYAETYAEVSPSGNGIKALFTDEVAEAIRNDGTGIEIYGDGRFFTVTGQHWEGTPTEIGPAPRTLAKLIATAEAAREDKHEEKRAKPNGAHTNGYANGDARGGDDFFARVNETALANLDRWVPALHPKAKLYPNGAWRIPAADIGREDLQEDLSYHPTGISGWGEENKFTAIDAVMRFGKHPNAKAAAFWLCEQLGVTPASLGWRDKSERAKSTDQPNAWLNPDMSIAERSQIKPPVLPTTGFGGLKEWLSNAADAASAPIDYTALAVLSGVSGMIGGRRWVEPWPGWKEPCIIWGAIVGDPSVNKTPSTDAIRAAIMAAEEHKAADFPQRESEYETKLATAKAVRKVWERQVAKALEDGKEPPVMPEGAIEPKCPIRPRSWVTNATTEKLARILSENPGGVIAWTDELAGLIGAFDRYGGGGMDRAFWLECHGGRPYRLDRVKDGTIDVPCTAAAVLGCIQPDRLHSLVLSGDNDGFASRFLYAWPEPRERKRPKLAPNWELISKAFERLAGLAPDAIVLPLNLKAANAFQHWWEGEHSKAIAAVSGVLAEAYNKMSGGALRIALALEYIWWATAQNVSPEPKVVSEKAIGHALIIVDQWAKPMAGRVLAEASIPLSQQRATTLARWVLATKPERFNARTVLRKHRGQLPGIRETKDMDEACAALVDAGWLRPAGTREGDTRGRTTKDFEVNPAVTGVKSRVP
jgi:hypothetical protein